MKSQYVEELAVLKCLQEAVQEALDRKRRLGQYAVVWKDGDVAYIGPNAPVAQGHPRGSGKHSQESVR
ncbi:hypothetical protein [Castellaniella sp.]|uniref:hypothetical protein n=1 Tax=Castellaniella sp. TaxID=1955812 RepID=UPI003217D13E